jgi:pyridoxamine 5'-phosphate oxidase
MEKDEGGGGSDGERAGAQEAASSDGPATYGGRMSESLRDLLTATSTRPAREPDWDPDAAPEEPFPLFAEWLRAAVEDRLLAASAAVLATATADGTPSARTLLLADATADGFWFATDAAGPAGRDLAENPVAALTLHWREHARQVRITGEVARGNGDRAAEWFRRRSPGARATALAGRQSDPLPADAADRIAAARAELEQDDDAVDPDYAAYLLTPYAVEFWQSRHEAGEQRLRYRRQHGGWHRERLWP